MALNETLTDGAKSLADAITAGGMGRADLGGGGTAWSWTNGLPPTLANYVTVATADGMSAKVTSVAESGTPAALVGPGEAKPEATQLTAGSVQLRKFAGKATFDLEERLDAKGLESAIAATLGRSILRAFEAHAVGVLAAGAGTTVPAPADWLTGVAQAQGELIAAGGRPSVVVVSAADYAGMVGDILGTSAFSMDPEDSPAGAVLGSLLHVSSGAPAGTAYVLDANAVLAVQHAESPIGYLDSLSQAANNRTQLVIDLIAACHVVSGEGVVAVTAPAAP